ncbi:MAG: FAD-dependent oxidoreductase [Pseudomonadota bacterium]
MIVGAGHAGGRMAEALRAAGVTAPIHLIGAERYPPYERPPLSKDLLTGKVAIETTFLQPAGFWGPSTISRSSSACARLGSTGRRAGSRSAMEAASTMAAWCSRPAAGRAGSACRAPTRRACAMCATSRTPRRCRRCWCRARASRSSAPA